MVITYKKSMRTHALILLIISANGIAAPTTLAALNGIHHQDSSGGTNLQKISTVLRESKAQQDNETAQRKNNVVVAQEHLKNCATLAERSERTACEKKYKAIVKGTLRACGADCP